MCVQQEKTKLATVTADHMKQHELHKNKIHELKEKLSKSEVTYIMTEQSCAAYIYTHVYCEANTSYAQSKLMPTSV